MSSVQRFSIQAFRFLTQHRFVYIHCDLVVCNRNYLNSTCARGNICPRRYRRDVNKMSSSDDSSRMYALSFGPLMYTKESDDERNTGWYCIWTTKAYIHIYIVSPYEGMVRLKKEEIFYFICENLTFNIRFLHIIYFYFLIWIIILHIWNFVFPY